MQIFKIFKRDIALSLISKGNRLIYTESNRKKNWLRVFCFEDTSKLHEDLTNYNK
jgi:hypothetical protein